MRASLALASAAVFIAASAGAIVCSVPASHSTISAAVADDDCTTIELQATVYEESVTIPRSLSLKGAAGGGSLVEGRITATGAATVLALQDLTLRSSCLPRTFSSRQGARTESKNVEVREQPTASCSPEIIFQDGFESGNSNAWSSTAP